MTYSEQHGGSDSLHDMGDSSQYQYPPLPEDGDDRIKPYYQQTSSSNISVILPSISHDTLGPQPHSHPQDSLANLPDTGDAQLPLPEYGRNQHGSWNGSQHMSFTQSAPRQRAAIACRYCRRRKIRCFGSGENEQGRCTNCQRFQKECIFMPVSGQAQVFVPAHVVYPHMRNMGVDSGGRVQSMHSHAHQLYGAHGQPLGQISPPTAGSPYYGAPPTEICGSFADERIEGSRKRRRIEPSIFPAPILGQPYFVQDSPRRLAAEDDLHPPPATPTAGPGLQHTSYSPELFISSNLGLQPLPEGLPSISQSRNPPQRSSPCQRFDTLVLANSTESWASGIDKSMLERLGRKPT